MSKEEVQQSIQAENEKLRTLASNFLASGNTVSVDTLTDLLVLVSLKSASETYARIKEDLFSTTMRNTDRRKGSILAL